MEQIPRVFQDFFEASSPTIKQFHGSSDIQPKSWGDQLRERVLSLEPDLKIIAWEEVAEGAVAGVIAFWAGVDPFLFTANGIQDIPIQTDLWAVDPYYNEHLSDITAYRQWGTSRLNNTADQEELSKFSHWIENGKEFLERLRGISRQSSF